MVVGDSYRDSCFWLILFGLNVVDCSFLMDLANKLASNNVKCLVVISEHKSESDFMIDTSHLSGISFSLFDINTSLSDLSAVGKNCLYNLLIFDSVSSSQHFLNRYETTIWKVNLHHGIFYAYFRSVRREEEIDPYIRSYSNEEEIEDSYYLRRNHSFYIHVLNDAAGQEEVKSLFFSDFYSKVLNAVAITRDRGAKESLSMWTKSPCATVSPKLTNVWTKSSGFRKGFDFNL